MKKFFVFILFFISIFTVSLTSVSAADIEVPYKYPISGWYTFTNTAQLRGDSLYWNYPPDFDGYPIVTGNAYYYFFNFTLAYPVVSTEERDSAGNFLNYSLAKGMVVYDLGNDLMGLNYIFVNPGIDVYDIEIAVYRGDWLDAGFKQILISDTYMPEDFINFLTSNGSFNYIPPQNNSSITDLIITYVDIPTRIMFSMLDINVMGSTLFVVVVGILTIVFVVYLFKRLL